MKPLLSATVGGVATALLILVLALLTPPVMPADRTAAPVAPRAIVPAAIETSVAPEALPGRAGRTGGARLGRAPGRGAARVAGSAAAAPAAARPMAPLPRPGAPAPTVVVQGAGASWGPDVLAPGPLFFGEPGGGDSGAAPGASPGSGGGTGSRATPPAATMRPPGVTRNAVAEFAPQPAYPAGARSREQSGVVEATIHVDANGSVTAVEVSGGSGIAEFEEAVRATVMRWRFRPALRDGVPRASAVRRRFAFQMVDR